MWKEPDWSWAPPQMLSKHSDWIRNLELSWNLDADWLLPHCLRCAGWCVWCVQVVNSSEQLLLIPPFSCGKKVHWCWWGSEKECSSDFFMDLFPVSLGGSRFPLVPNQTSLPLMSQFFFSALSIGIEWAKREREKANPNVPNSSDEDIQARWRIIVCLHLCQCVGVQLQ